MLYKNVPRRMCDICGTQEEKKVVWLAHSFSGAVGGIRFKKEVYVCPHEDESWHQKIIHLKKEAKNTHSEKIRSIIESEISEILESNKDKNV